MHGHSPRSPRQRKIPTITAVEEDDDFEDVIPGPPSSFPPVPNLNISRGSSQGSASSSRRRGGSIVSRVLSASRSGGQKASDDSYRDELQLSYTEHWAGQGILASRQDLEMPAEEFAAGCNLLQAAARGDIPAVTELLNKRPEHVNFRDYDRRTALHVSASEGHLDMCKFLIEKKKAKVNRSDRWGGSPLDDAHRHRHRRVVEYLRSKGALTGSGNRTNNLITASAEGDTDEVKMILKYSGAKGDSSSGIDVNKGDYDKRTALHLASGEGHADIVKILCDAGADVNVEDRWGRRPLDDAISSENEECIKILREFGAASGPRKSLSNSNGLSASNRLAVDNMKVEFQELEMIDRIGAGAFGEIYKCRWRGTLVAAKIVKTAKIRREWLNKKTLQNLESGVDAEEALAELDEAELPEEEKQEALADFRQEIAVLKGLRHPHIVLLLAYSTTTNYEVMISELMKCSLLDVFKSHMVQGTRLSKQRQIIYATQIALGMNYLHTCNPPIIHRDLKPANLLIDHSGVLKISDFGLSKIRPDPAKKETDQFQMTGETGSYRFMAPEVFRREYYTEVVDIYSFAMILFYLLVGRPPWPTLPGLTAVKRASEAGDRPNIPRDLDARLQTLLKECWDENPSLRPPFQRIIEILTTYNQDVFKQSANDVARAKEDDIVPPSCCSIL